MDIADAPQGLDTLTVQINDALFRRERSKEEWVEATIELCECLAKARAEFTSNNAFGAWFDSSGINLTEKDRAAAIAMGEQIEVARKVLAATERRSLQHIRKIEFSRLAHVSRTEKPKKKPPPKQPLTAALEKALHVYDRRKQAGEGLTYEEIAKEAGVSETPVRRALAMREAQERSDSDVAATLSMSAKEKLQAAIRAEIKRLQLDAETAAINESKKRLNEWHLPNYMALLHKVEDMLKYKRGILTRADYRKILRCIHPDTGAHVSDALRNEAFRLFTAHEAKLVNDAEQADLKRVSTLPQTVAEMMARRKVKS